MRTLLLAGMGDKVNTIHPAADGEQAEQGPCRCDGDLSSGHLHVQFFTSAPYDRPLTGAFSNLIHAVL